MSECGLYRVVGKRDYRGHSQGTEFPARLDPRAAQRAIDRGSIERIGTVTMRPQHFILPRGWLPQDQDNKQGKEA